MSDWDCAENWYHECVGEKGHYYHQSLIFPNVIRLLALPGSKSLEKGQKYSLVDFGCGQGVLARQLPKHIVYTGIDLSKNLLARAKHATEAERPLAHFIHADASQPLSITKTDFDAAVFILSLQNMEDQEGAIANAARHLKENGKLLLVLNHPCFRIPRQSSWMVDEKMQLQYRRINSYMSHMHVPMQVHPGKGEKGGVVFSYHYPLSDYMKWLYKHGFALTMMEEWCSDKKSQGKKARMENRARSEIPLFLTLVANLFKKSIKG